MYTSTKTPFQKVMIVKLCKVAFLTLLFTLKSNVYICEYLFHLLTIKLDQNEELNTVSSTWWMLNHNLFDMG